MPNNDKIKVDHNGSVYAQNHYLRCRGVKRKDGKLVAIWQCKHCHQALLVPIPDWKHFGKPTMELIKDFPACTKGPPQGTPVIKK